MNVGQGKRKKRIYFWLKIFFGVYFTGGIALYFLQDKLLFHPQALAEDYVFNFNKPFVEMNVQYNSFTRFNIIRFLPDTNSVKKGAVIYLHGNMENINHYAIYADNFTKHGYEVWMMDYPGFGKSTGTLNESIMETEALEVYKMVRSKGCSPDSIIVYGKSLGTGIAAKLASIRDCKRLILESPYYSLVDVAKHYCWMYPVEWMIHDNIITYKYLEKVTAPVTIFHGTDDNIIIFKNSEELKTQCFKKGDELIAIEGAHHNDLNDYPLMEEKLDSLLAL